MGEVSSRIPKLEGDAKSPAHIILGVTGSIAAYRALDLVRRLRDQGAVVSVIMTASAQRLVTPLAFEVVSGSRTYTDMWQPRSYQGGIQQGAVEHIDLASMASALLIAPATANVIGKIAQGIADDLLTTVALACTAPMLVAPAMNSRMWLNRVVQANIATLRALGCTVIEPEHGSLACGEQGVGRLASIETITKVVWDRLAQGKLLSGRRLIITAGATEERLDPVRVLTNRSSGKMGIALAEAACRLGAQVVLIAGRVAVPLAVSYEVVRVGSTQEMLRAVKACLRQADCLVMAAAPSDFCPSHVASEKIKASSIEVKLKRTPDILRQIRKDHPGLLRVGFSLETQDELGYARRKLQAKGLDLVVANSPATIGEDTIAPTLVFRDGTTRRLPQQSKAEFAGTLVHEIARLLSLRQARISGTPGPVPG
ncbi:MAG: bifunctional phosphopantothenoylcysteine decarboxylase/phosphopantothenate--cysteine ligase CoaBC [candidate division WOR-3 bacterium]